MDPKQRTKLESYIMKNIEICELPDRIEILRMIIKEIGTEKLTVVGDGTMVMMDQMPDRLILTIGAFMKDRDKQCAIDFSDIEN